MPFDLLVRRSIAWPVLVGLLMLVCACAVWTLEIDPRQPGAHNNLGNILAALGRADEALASYDAAIAVQPGYAQAHHNRGNVLADLRRTSEAIGSYQQVLTITPRFFQRYNW